MVKFLIIQMIRQFLQDAKWVSPHPKETQLRDWQISWKQICLVKMYLTWVTQIIVPTHLQLRLILPTHSSFNSLVLPWLWILSRLTFIILIPASMKQETCWLTPLLGLRFWNTKPSIVCLLEAFLNTWTILLSFFGFFVICRRIAAQRNSSSPFPTTSGS